MDRVLWDWTEKWPNVLSALVSYIHWTRPPGATIITAKSTTTHEYLSYPINKARTMVRAGQCQEDVDMECMNGWYLQNVNAVMIGYNARVSRLLFRVQGRKGQGCQTTKSQATHKGGLPNSTDKCPKWNSCSVCTINRPHKHVTTPQNGQDWWMISYFNPYDHFVLHGNW